MAAVLTGGLPGRKGGGERRSVSVDGWKKGPAAENEVRVGSQGGSPSVTASYADVRKVLESAQVPYKGTTVIGHGLSKHAGRKPAIGGKTKGASSTWNDQAMKHLREIGRVPGEFKHVKNEKVSVLWKSDCQMGEV